MFTHGHMHTHMQVQFYAHTHANTYKSVYIRTVRRYLRTVCRILTYTYSACTLTHACTLMHEHSCTHSRPLTLLYILVNTHSCTPARACRLVQCTHVHANSCNAPSFTRIRACILVHTHPCMHSRAHSFVPEDSCTHYIHSHTSMPPTYQVDLWCITICFYTITFFSLSSYAGMVGCIFIYLFIYLLRQ